MATSWTKPAFTHGTYNSAGQVLANRRSTPEQIDRALGILNNWRSSHSFPLNTIQMNLRHNATRVDDGALIAQRLKRASSVIAKLQRYPKMHLARMQDIGGCRAVVKGVEEVQRLYQFYLTKTRVEHELHRHDDYVSAPKLSGYRSVHLVYKYRSGVERLQAYNGLLIEVQIRSRLQHAWATAVETMGTFLQTSLKSSEGPEQWLRFFILTGSVFAEIEGTPYVQDTPTNPSELKEAVREMWSAYQVRKRLETYQLALRMLERLEKRPEKPFHYYLLRLNIPARSLSVYGFPKEQIEAATTAYLGIEKEIVEGGKQEEAVLVSADSPKALRDAYPSYFLDTTVFVTRIQAYLDGEA
jgi:ppGpp synthetase/RelA/SpoT-type nucleotidyltranferase